MVLEFDKSRQDALNSRQVSGRFLIPGQAIGDVVFSNVPLSFMMGVDIETGMIMDKHHPLYGTSIKGKIFALPCGRGSCGGSGVMLEILRQQVAPAALVFRKMEEILTLGVLVSKMMFFKSIPVILLEDDEAFGLLENVNAAQIKEGQLIIGNDEIRIPLLTTAERVALTEADRRVLNGDDCSIAKRMAMEIIVEFSAIQGAKSLVDVSQVHVDACCYAGKISLLIPERLHALGGEFVVPATCNSLDVDRQRWKELEADPEISKISSKIGDIYLAMGAQMSFTCAPYLLNSKPGIGEQVAWGESNAVVFSNSVLGARTQKYPDFLEVLIALTGRAPYVGCHLDEGRLPKIRILVPKFNNPDESLFPLVGYHIGDLVGSEIPIIYGLEDSKPSIADLKAFGAGFATTSSAPMFHINGITPEAATVNIDLAKLPPVALDLRKLRLTWKQLNTAKKTYVDLISLGNPHFDLEEFARLAALCMGRCKHSDVTMIITTSRYVYQEALNKGYLEIIESFGARLITDTCWCMIQEPVIPPHSRTIMTNSAKYAHYGPGMLKRGYHFGSLAGCVEASCMGERRPDDIAPRWLFGPPSELLCQV